MPKGVFVRIPGGREKENILCPICGDKFERIINHKYPKCCGKESCKHVIASEVAKKRKGYPSWNIGLQGIDPTKANYDESVAKISKSKIGKNCKEREIRICPVCNAPYKAIKGNKYPMFCSRICADVVRKSKREVRICANEQCTKGIDNKRKKFLALIDKEFPQCCCHECADFKRRSKKIVVTCLNKNCTKGINGKRKQFEDVEGGIRKFCCNDCYHETKKGMKSFFVWEKGKSWNKIPILQDYTQMYQWLVIKSLYYKQVAKIVGCNQISVSYHAEQLGIKKLIPIRHQTEEAKKNAKAGRLRRIRKIGHSFWFTTPFSNSSTLPICTKIDGILSKYYGIDVRSRYAGNIGRGEDKIGERSIDFSNKDFIPVIAVEFNEKEHDKEKDKERWNEIRSMSLCPICSVDIDFPDKWRNPEILNEKKQWEIANGIVRTIINEGCKPKIEAMLTQLKTQLQLS